MSQTPSLERSISYKGCLNKRNISNDSLSEGSQLFPHSVDSEQKGLLEASCAMVLNKGLTEKQGGSLQEVKEHWKRFLY